MKKISLTLATLALVLSPSFATAAGPAPNPTNPPKTVQSNGTRQNVSTTREVVQYHDRSPRIHDRGTNIAR